MAKQLGADSATIARNLALIDSRINAACARVDRSPQDVRLCVATKYVDLEGMRALKDAGVRIAAENRLQDMLIKQERFTDAFEWHFIGAIQSRKVEQIAASVSMIHSLGSESARNRLNRFSSELPVIFVQVNVSREESKAGIAADELAAFLDGCNFTVSGLSTMPPPSERPEDARPHFRRLAELAREHGLDRLSIGTTQDFEVAIEEGATELRVGSLLFEP